MFKKILLTAVLTFALSTSTAWAQGCDGCAGGGAAVAGGYGGGYGGGGCASGGCDGGGYDGGAIDVGQDYFGGAAACGDCGGNCGDRCGFIRFFGGINFIENEIDPAGFEIDFEDGWGAGFALGRRNGNRRFEVEITHRHNSLSTIFDNGNITQLSNMYNLLFDLDFLSINGAQFYAGGGIGLTYADINVVTIPAEAFDLAFSYQGIAGFSKQLRNGANGFVEYRYLASEFDFGGGPTDIDNHSIFFGIELAR